VSGRFLAIDLGQRRTGLALGDAQTRVVSALSVLDIPMAREQGGALLRAIDDAIRASLDPRGEIVLGLPLNMDGTEGPAAAEARRFADVLRARTGRTVHLHDERLTSVEAAGALAGSGLTRAGKRRRQDALAAAAILRDFLASRLGAAPGP
jgi:putative Holliday junction resolvase